MTNNIEDASPSVEDASPSQEPIQADLETAQESASADLETPSALHDAVAQVEDEERSDKPWSVRARIRSFFYDWPSAAARQWPLLLVILAFGVGLVLIYLDYWRRGSFVVGAAIGLAGFLRLVLPTRLAGLLVVRSKLLDVLFPSVAGALVMALSWAAMAN